MTRDTASIRAEEDFKRKELKRIKEDSKEKGQKGQTGLQAGATSEKLPCRLPEGGSYVSPLLQAAIK